MKQLGHLVVVSVSVQQRNQPNRVAGRGEMELSHYHLCGVNGQSVAETDVWRMHLR